MTKFRFSFQFIFTFFAFFLLCREVDSNNFPSIVFVEPEEETVVVDVFELRMVNGDFNGKPVGILKQEHGGNRFIFQAGFQFFEGDDKLYRKCPAKFICGFDGHNYWIAVYKDSFSQKERTSESPTAALTWTGDTKMTKKIPRKLAFGSYARVVSITRQIFYFQRLIAELTSDLKDELDCETIRNSKLVSEWEDVPWEKQSKELVEKNGVIFLKFEFSEIWLVPSETLPSPIEAMYVFGSFSGSHMGPGPLPQAYLPYSYSLNQIDSNEIAESEFSIGRLDLNGKRTHDITASEQPE